MIGLADGLAVKREGESEVKNIAQVFLFRKTE